MPHNSLKKINNKDCVVNVALIVFKNFVFVPAYGMQLIVSILVQQTLNLTLMIHG